MNARSVARGKLSSTRTPVNSGTGKSSARHSIGVRRARASSSGTSFCRGAEWVLRSASYSARCCATNSGLPSSLRSALVTGTARLASSTWTTGSLYCGAIFTAVCARLVVAPPMSRGNLNPWRSISRATCTISSRDGVIRPLTPIRSASPLWPAPKAFRRGPSLPGRSPRSCCRPEPRPQCSCRCRERRPWPSQARSFPAL